MKNSLRFLLTGIMLVALLAAPAMAQIQTTWKHVGGAPYVGTDEAAIKSASNVTSTARTHLWDLWATGSRSKVQIPRGTVLAAVNNKGGWTLRNVSCVWETPQRFASLPAYEVAWQEGSVNYRVGKFAKDLNPLNCGNWYVIVEYRKPQVTPSSSPQARDFGSRNISFAVKVSDGGTFINNGAFGDHSRAEMGDVNVHSFNTNAYPKGVGGNTDGGTNGLADERGSNGFVENAANAVYDYLDIYVGARYVELSNDQIFRVGYVGADLKFWKGFGVFGEIGLGRDSQFRAGFPLPVRNEYRAFGLRAQFQKKLLLIQTKASLTMVGDEIRMGSNKIGEFGTQAGEFYQSAQTLMGISAKFQFGPVFAEGGMFWGGDYISVANEPATVSAKSISLGLSAKGFIETLKNVF